MSGAGTNRRAVNRTVRALRASGTLTDQHGALVQLVTSLADQVDREPSDAQLWREYRLAVVELSKLGSDGTDAFSDLVTRLRAPLGNSAN